MIYINHVKKAIFIHIPKTGGTYIGPTLVKYYGFISYLPLIQKRRPDHDNFCKTHFFIPTKTGNSGYDNSFFNKLHGILSYCKTSDYLNEKMNMNQEKWKYYKKFCFIRNPYSRALSGWKHVNTILNLNTEFYNYMSKNKFLVSDIEFGHVFMSQKQQIQELNGICGVDLIGKFENLEEDFKYILHEVGFDKIIHTPKKVNVSNEDGADMIVLEKKTIQVLNDLFKDDFQLFHYNKIDV
jgi:hypothetical protein